MKNINDEGNNHNKNTSAFIQLNEKINKSILSATNNVIQQYNTLNKAQEIIAKSSQIYIDNLMPYSQMKFLTETMNASLIPKLNGMSSVLGNLVQSQIKLIDDKIIPNISNSVIIAINQIYESQRNLLNILSEAIQFKNPLFDSLTKTLSELEKNPNSVVSWLNYYDKLSEFFWIMPYQMSVEELHDVLMNVKNEKEFDIYLNKYFSTKKIDMLKSDILNMLTSNQEKKLFKQITFAYDNKSFALANLGLISMIDNLLSFYIIDKGCVSRRKMFEPIIDDIKNRMNLSDDFPYIVMMINSNINLLYEQIEFNEKITIKTNKKSRRNPLAHGKIYVNKKIETIMLFNTVYYLLIAQNELRNYKNCLVYNRNKKHFSIVSKEDKKILKEKISNNIKTKKSKSCNNEKK